MVWLLFIFTLGFVFYYKGKYEQAERLRKMHCRLSNEWEQKYRSVTEGAKQEVEKKC